MAKNARADESILHPATTNSVSLRTTIPSYIVAKLELERGHRFRWCIESEGLRIEVIKE